jgi:hypothetical protein
LILLHFFYHILMIYFFITDNSIIKHFLFVSEIIKIFRIVLLLFIFFIAAITRLRIIAYEVIELHNYRNDIFYFLFVFIILVFYYLKNQGLLFCYFFGKFSIYQHYFLYLFQILSLLLTTPLHIWFIHH